MAPDPSAIPPAEQLYEAHRLACEALASLDRRTSAYKRLARAVALLPYAPMSSILKQEYER